MVVSRGIPMTNETPRFFSLFNFEFFRANRATACTENDYPFFRRTRDDISLFDRQKFEAIYSAVIVSRELRSFKQ